MPHYEFYCEKYEKEVTLTRVRSGDLEDEAQRYRTCGPRI